MAARCAIPTVLIIPEKELAENETKAALGREKQEIRKMGISEFNFKCKLNLANYTV